MGPTPTAADTCAPTPTEGSASRSDLIAATDAAHDGNRNALTVGCGVVPAPATPPPPQHSTIHHGHVHHTYKSKVIRM
jgi:hypothetical protein